MARYAIGPLDEEGYPELIDLDAGSSPPDVKLRLIDMDDVVGFSDVYDRPKKNAAAGGRKGKKRRDLGYTETAEERAKERRREASRRYYMKYVAPVFFFAWCNYLTYR